jgi:hypothetical protein
MIKENRLPFTLLLVFVAIAVAAVASSGLQPPVTVLGPTPSTQAITPSTGTPRPTARPAATASPAQVGFDYWMHMYRTWVAPCYSAGTCDLEATVAYTDGTTKKLGPEVERLGALYRDNYALQIENYPECPDETGSAFAQMASLSAEISLLAELDESERGSIEWQPTLSVQYSKCGTTTSTLAARLTLLKDSFLDARRVLAQAKSRIGKQDWAAVLKAGDAMGEIGVKIARYAGRDVPATGSWEEARAAAWSLLDLGGRLHTKRLARDDATSTDLDTIASSLDALIADLP